ncbi:hypothetical protein R1sor_019420 [Riccia sorocarpa]|uniref:Uncharacterized protein n=1 Tax=Riccia sorocarpa TaxID=122646 RepID=A0ABD3ICH8_9MARC
MHRVKLIPIRTTYVVQPPFPKELTINQLLDVERPPLEFRIADVSEHYGSVVIINSKWTEERQDWYLNGLEFVCIRKLERGKQSVAGPFKVVRKEGDFVILEAADKSHFSHPSFMKKTSSESTQFRSTVAWMWSRECLCEKNDSSVIQVDCNCLCQATLRRGFCLRCPQARMKQKTISETMADPKNIAETMTDLKKPPPPQKPKEPAPSPSKDKVNLKAKAAAGPSKPSRKPRTVAAKDLDLSITVGIAGEEVGTVHRQERQDGHNLLRERRRTSSLTYHISRV